MYGISAMESILNHQTETIKKQKRTLNLIAEFVEGYAKDWYFAVGEYFKDSLDIKMTERMEPFFINGVKQYEIRLIKGVEKRVPQKRRVLRWTQGNHYTFSKGDVLYDTPDGYLPWIEALQHIKLMCQVIDSKPCSTDVEGKFLDGYVIFTLSKPNETRDGMKKIGQYRLCQTEFVKFLKSGDTESLIRQ